MPPALSYVPPSPSDTLNTCAHCTFASPTSHDKYAGDKNIVLVPGGHNSDRPKFFMDSAAIFLRDHMFIPAGVSVAL